MWSWLVGSPPAAFETRLVRLHLKGEEFSLAGIWIGNEAGHYRLAKAEQIEAPDRSFVVEGEAWIPAERVLYVQVLQ